MKSHKENRGHYSDIACGGSTAHNRKQTLICPICGYTSRIKIAFPDNKFYVASYKCPVHGELQGLGTITRIPRKKSKKFKKFLGK